MSTDYDPENVKVGEPDIDAIEETMAEAQYEMIEANKHMELAKKELGMPTPQLPEAPYSSTIAGYYKGYAVTKTHRSFKPIPNEIVVASIEDMISRGFKPSWNEETNGKHLQEVKVEPNTPVCPTHNKAMTLREGKFGKFWSCSTKNPDGTWCKYTPSLKVEDMP